MKKCLTFCILCCFTIMLFPSNIQASIDKNAEANRYYTWLYQLPVSDTMTTYDYTMENDLYLGYDRYNLYAGMNRHINIHTNGYKIYLENEYYLDKDYEFDEEYDVVSLSFDHISILGNQDQLIEVGEYVWLSLWDCEVKNEGGSAFLLKDHSTLCGDSQFSNHISAKDIAIKSTGNITIDRLVVEAPIAIQNDEHIAMYFSNIEGSVQANSIHKELSYIKDLQAQTIEKIVDGTLKYPNTSIVLTYLEGSDLVKDVLPYITFDMTLYGDNDYYSIGMTVDYDEHGNIVYVLPDELDNILTQNQIQYGEDQPFQVILKPFDTFYAKFSIVDENGYKPNLVIPSLFGAEHVYLDYRKPNEAWSTCENISNLVNFDDSLGETNVTFLDYMEKGMLYEFKFRIVGGMYDGIESEPFTFTVNNTSLGDQFEVPMKKEDPKPIQPPTNEEEEKEENDPDDIVGNEGQGGGRDESDYQPEQNEPEGEQPTKPTPPAISFNKPQLKPQMPSQTPTMTEKEPIKKQENVSTSDTTHSTIALLSSIFALVVLQSVKRKLS